jgi:hypothetical protein
MVKSDLELFKREQILKNAGFKINKVIEK